MSGSTLINCLFMAELQSQKSASDSPDSASSTRNAGCLASQRPASCIQSSLGDTMRKPSTSRRSSRVLSPVTKTSALPPSAHPTIGTSTASLIGTDGGCFDELRLLPQECKQLGRG